MSEVLQIPYDNLLLRTLGATGAEVQLSCVVSPGETLSNPPGPTRMGLFQVEEPGDASTRTRDAADAPCISRLRATSPPTPTPPPLPSETQAPEPEPEPRRGGPLQTPSPPATRAAGRGTAAPRPDRADSAPARPHPVDPPGRQPGDDRSERAAAELQPGLLTPDAATLRPPGKGEVVRSSPGDVPRGLRRQEAALQPRLRLAHNAIGRRVCPVLQGLGATGRPGQPHNALQGLEKKKGCTTQPWGGITDLSATCELGPWRFSHSIPGDVTGTWERDRNPLLYRTGKRRFGLARMCNPFASLGNTE